MSAVFGWSPWGAPVPGMSFSPLAYGILFVLGLVLGSFLNVVIHRLPRDRSIVWPPSSCPVCSARIRPWDNIPVVSWLWLGGRCRDCRAPISWRYPAVELAAALLLVGLAFALGPRPALVPAAFFSLALLAVAIIDFEFRIIPDEISLGGLALGLLARGFTPADIATGLVGALAGGGSLWLAAYGYRRLTGVEGMGGGDIKLAGMIGAFLGWPGVFLTVFGAALAGSVVGAAILVAKRGDRRTALPFGTFLAPAAVFAAFVGPSLWRWYGGLFLH